MSIYKYLREFWQGQDAQAALRARMIEWRKQPATVRLERPERLDRARSVGYKAKQGYIVVRQRVNRGGRQRPAIVRGRRPKHNRQKKILKLNYRAVAEGRAQQEFKNLVVLNSYPLAKDGLHAWYEIIMIDPQHPNLQKDRNNRDLSKQKGRVERGLTNAGRRGRGLKGKGKGYENARPSLNANRGHHN